MSGRHRDARRRAAAPTARRLAGAGASAAVAVFAVAPLAHADAKPRPVTDSGATGTDQAGTAGRTAKVAAVEPNFGTQKVRVGVQLKDGDFYPAGTDTGGTKISISETGPNASLAAQVYGDSCTTVEGSEVSPGTETFCDFSRIGQNLRNEPALQRRVEAAGVSARQLAAIPSSADYLVFPGDTVTFQQSSVNDDMLIDPDPQSFGPCVTPQADVPQLQAAPEFPTCDAETPVPIAFTDPGVPPVAKHDAGTVPPGGSITIKVVGNDTTAGAQATVKIIDQPAHGTAKVVNQASATVRALRGAPAAPSIRYTPDAGFFGHDSLRYSLTTPNGTSTATVSLLVAAPPTARDDSASTAAGDPITIDVLGNDSRNGGGALSIDSVADPGHGTVVIKDGAVVYTPDDGFAGTDTFTYVARNSLGTDTATVTVTVSGVADTGAPSGDLIVIASLLIAAGGAATVAGRRRYTARHAGGA